MKKRQAEDRNSWYSACFAAYLTKVVGVGYT